MTGHTLIIRKHSKMLGVTKASCSCGKWVFSRPYRMTKGEITEEHEKHLANLFKPPKMQTGLNEKGQAMLEEAGQINLTKGAV